MQKPSLPRGTRDFGPLVASRRKYITDIIERHFQVYGFNRLETPAMENLSVLTGKYGDEGDQLLFKVLNSGDYLKKSNSSDFDMGSKILLPKISEKGLRYDLTVPFARYVVMNQHETVMPFKRYQIQPVWRADRPAHGRYREFYQCDADIVGTTSLWNETELTLLIHDVMSSLGIEDFILKVNHREVLFSIAQYVGMDGKEIAFCTELDKLDKIGAKAVTENLIISGAKEKTLNDVMNLIGEEQETDAKLDRIRELLGEDHHGVSQLSDYFDMLTKLGKKGNTSLDLSLARGLSYYTGAIFEVKPTKVKMGSICGGGRYDDLTGIFGLSDVSGVGISFGLDRLYDVMVELDLFPEEQTFLSIFITHLDQKSFEFGQQILHEFREADIPADIYPEPAKLKKQLTYANKTGVPFVITIGEDEMKTGKLSFKDMKDGMQSTLTVTEILNSLRKKD